MDDFPLTIASTGGIAAFGVVQMIIGLVIYIYVSYSVMKIASKLNVNNGWWAFIPILNIVLLIRMAEKPLWWILLFLIPLVNVVIAVLLWMKVAERRGKASWLGILIIIPFANLVLPGYLAFTD